MLVSKKKKSTALRFKISFNQGLVLAWPIFAVGVFAHWAQLSETVRSEQTEANAVPVLLLLTYSTFGSANFIFIF